MIHGDYFTQKAKNIHGVKEIHLLLEDYILTKSMCFDKTIECNIHSVASTDHRGCSVLVKFAEIERGPGYWKFNNSLLKDSIFVNQMNTVIGNHTASLDSKSDNQLEWELLKVKIKDFTRNYSKQKSIHNRSTLAELYGKLNDIDLPLTQNVSLPKTSVTGSK